MTSNMQKQMPRAHSRYVLALMVLVASDHLILSRERPIEPLWITYYVFMTLNFDNMPPGKT